MITVLRSGLVPLKRQVGEVRYTKKIRINAYRYEKGLEQYHQQGEGFVVTNCIKEELKGLLHF